MIRRLFIVAIAAATFSFPAVAGHHGPKDIVDTAVKAGSFNTLVAALKAAGLVDALKGDGPFTVFAPTDEAFAKIPKADLDALLKDKAKLTAVLTYHVVPGKVMAKEADIFLCDAGEDMQRRVMAQDFLDDRGGTVGSGVDLGGQEQRHAIADAVHCCFVPCVQQQDAGRDHLGQGQARAVFFGGDELGDQVVGGGRTASLDVVSKKGAELLGRGDGGTFDFGAAAGLIHRHHGVGPMQQIRPEGVWNAQEPGDDRDGQGAGKTL